MRIGMFTAAQWSPEENPAAFLKSLREQVRAARDHGFSSAARGPAPADRPDGHVPDQPVARPSGGGCGRHADRPRRPVAVDDEPGARGRGSGDPRLAVRRQLRARRRPRLSARGVPGHGRGPARARRAPDRGPGGDQAAVDRGQRDPPRPILPARRRQASVRPKQSPRPPIWLGGDVEPAVRRAARIADAWCIAPTSSIRSIAGRPRGLSRRAAQDRPAGRRQLPADPGMLRRSRRRARQAMPAAGRSCSNTAPTLPGARARPRSATSAPPSTTSPGTGS